MDDAEGEGKKGMTIIFIMKFDVIGRRTYLMASSSQISKSHDARRRRSMMMRYSKFS